MAQTLKDRIKRGNISVIIDETTDLSVKSQLGVIIQYFDEEEFRLSHQLLDLTSCTEKSAEGLTNALIGLLTQYGIEKNMIVGFCADTTNSMFGAYNSVSNLLTDYIPEIVCLKFSCHLIHLCSRYASS